MDQNKDYYAILGVHLTAEKAVIDAAYKALAKRYHPDMNQDNPDESKRRMQEINEAYEVLSDATKRKKYDKLRGDGTQQGEEFFRGGEESEPDYDPLTESWKVAVEYYPDLDEKFENLKKISWKLAYGFKASILETKKFNERNVIAKIMKGDFLERYFGNHEEIIEFVEQLIGLGEKKALKELNKTINILGINQISQEDEVLPVIKKISDKYKIKFKDKTYSNTNKPGVKVCVQCGKKSRIKFRCKRKNN